MSARVAGPGVLDVRASRFQRLGGVARRFVSGFFTLSAVVSVAGSASGCGEDRFQAILEEYALVGGNPRVDPSLPTIDRMTDDANVGDFGSNSALQVDLFEQTQVAKVDILWVIDNSGSMALYQEKVKTNFQAFMNTLVMNNETLDFHIGVVTTDTSDTLTGAGRLQNMAGLTKPWIGTDTCPVGTCDPVARFGQNAAVGTRGTDDEKGLLAAMLALSPPLTSPGGHNAGFLRDDAALFIIVLSDEEDSSCAPVNGSYGGGCTAPESFGTPAFYARFFEGLKGPGRQDLVTLGVIVAKTGSEQLAAPAVGRVGCKSASGDWAVHAPRYVEVAELVGGLATSICDENYVPALQNLGFLATGAKSSFVLSRPPYQDSIRVLVTTPGENPGDPETTTLQVRGTDYDYEPCAGSGGGVLNAIRFRPEYLPIAGSIIQVDYPVNVRGVSCQ